MQRAFVAARGFDDAPDAAAQALEYAWRHWSRVRLMQNPHGYLYRVGLSKSRDRRLPVSGFEMTVSELPSIEPALIPALRELPEKQRAAVWLVHACGWSYNDVAAALDVGVSTVGTHVTRGLESLRKQLGVQVAAPTERAADS